MLHVHQIHYYQVVRSTCECLKSTSRWRRRQEEVRLSSLEASLHFDGVIVIYESKGIGQTRSSSKIRHCGDVPEGSAYLNHTHDTLSHKMQAVMENTRGASQDVMQLIAASESVPTARGMHLRAAGRSFLRG